MMFLTVLGGLSVFAFLMVIGAIGISIMIDSYRKHKFHKEIRRMINNDQA